MIGHLGGGLDWAEALAFGGRAGAVPRFHLDGNAIDHVEVPSIFGDHYIHGIRPSPGQDVRARL